MIFYPRRKAKSKKKSKKSNKKAASKNGNKKPDPFSHLYQRNDDSNSSSIPSGFGIPKSEPQPYVPPRESIDRACEMKQDILNKIEKLGKILPANTLDQLIGKAHFRKLCIKPELEY